MGTGRFTPTALPGCGLFIRLLWKFSPFRDFLHRCRFESLFDLRNGAPTPYPLYGRLSGQPSSKVMTFGWRLFWRRHGKTHQTGLILQFSNFTMRNIFKKPNKIIMGTRLWVEKGKESHFNLIDNSKKIRTYANVWQCGMVLHIR